MQILRICVGDILELKKQHPCGGKEFEVLRVGSDVRIVCLSCKRDMTLDRVKLERSVKQIKHRQTESNSNGSCQPKEEK